MLDSRCTTGRFESHAAKASLFVLIQKVTKKIKTKKSFRPRGQTPGPVFCRAFARFFGTSIAKGTGELSFFQ